MDITKTQQWINDYLDLYLYAESIGDESWQQEIIEKLQKLSNEIQNSSFKIPVGLK
ncbi:hypothetical protein [Ectobacillus funiculus]|jgi:hypothetical protein|uniref:Uncharacterized protein n=1 Tax=Ectobacillus funiculus TaxID=137993 RepID=A0ABV5WFD4_9BACI